MRELRSTIIAALVAAIIPAVWLAIYQMTAAHPMFADRVGVLGFSVFVYCYAMVTAFACGYITLRVLRRIAIVRWWTATIAGAGWGALMLWIYGHSPIQMEPLLAWLSVGGLCGAAFWATWRWAGS